MKKFLLYVAIILLLTAGIAAAADESWIEFGGDYQLRYDNLVGEVVDHTEYVSGVAVPAHKVWNDALFTNRYGINIKAIPVEDVSFKFRMHMYKIWGHQTSMPIHGMYFGSPGMLLPTLDQAMGRVPGGGDVWADQAYMSWSNMFGYPVWFSIGRKPSSGGAPGNVRQNLEKTGSAGVPGNLIDSAFDGYTLGWAPDIEALPGFFMKWCQGKGFDSGYKTNYYFNADGESVYGTDNAGHNPTAYEYDRDVDFAGLMTTWTSSPELHIETLIMGAWNIMGAPSDWMNVRGKLWPNDVSMGNMKWWGGTIMGKPTDNLNIFGSIGQNYFEPFDKIEGFGFGMVWYKGTQPRSRHSGYGWYMGGRYDIPSTGTKIGLEYNGGTKYWMPFVPTSNDIWGNKLATRGNVYEIYIIQEIDDKAVAKRGKAFFRIGYQYYKFKYTGQLNWLEVPERVTDLALNDSDGNRAQFFVPLKSAKDLYVLLDVLF